MCRGAHGTQVLPIELLILAALVGRAVLRDERTFPVLPSATVTENPEDAFLRDGLIRQVAQITVLLPASRISPHTLPSNPLQHCGRRRNRKTNVYTLINELARGDRMHGALQIEPFPFSSLATPNRLDMSCRSDRLGNPYISNRRRNPATFSRSRSIHCRSATPTTAVGYG